ncbi:MAG TPA: BREX-1 system phosphatase PglZ type B [Rectinemataceae bacterium]|nr:BREX-1 system phosphatase PglZ type B [Rectinemataceae bacterium]
MTLFHVLVEQLIGAAKAAGSQASRPRAILWTDEAGEWIDVVPRLRTEIPGLVSFGDFDATIKRGPAVYLLPLIDRLLPEADWSTDTIPIVYLPGVGRAMLRDISSLEWNLQPLAALQYQSAFWTQTNGKDWTRLAFVTTESGPVAWKLAADEATKDAFRSTFSQWLDREVTDGLGRTLTAGDFHQAVLPDTGSMLLQWLCNPAGFQAGIAPDVWTAFVSEAKKAYHLDLEKQTVLDAVQMLSVPGDPSWDALWKRFTQTPSDYTALLALLEPLPAPKVSDMFNDTARFPAYNTAQEKALQQVLQKTKGRSVEELRQEVLSAEKNHAQRRASVWSRLGRSPLAMAVGVLAELAQATTKPLKAPDLETMAQEYTTAGWKADAAFLAVLSSEVPLELKDLVHKIADRMYRPWLQDASLAFQKLSPGYPRSQAKVAIPVDEGTCLLFVDGLRWDVGQSLVTRLGVAHLEATVTASWSALPTVTATAKPAVSPLEPFLTGAENPTTFEVATTAQFRKQLTELGYTVLGEDETGDGSGRAWAENGDLDTLGHGGMLEGNWSKVVDEIVYRVRGLVGAGWQVKIVTDHGWLYLPGELPKTEFAGLLSPNKGERAAWLHPGNPPTELQAPWFWNPLVSFQTSPGISTFWGGKQYSHGGLSLQECVVPTILVRGGASGDRSALSLTEKRWKGMRLVLNWTALPEGFKMDLRTAAADGRTTLIDGLMDLGPSLMVVDDDLVGQEHWLVALDGGGQIVFQEKLRIGG